MKIRSYKGPTLEKLYEAIRKELGPDAIVISTRNADKRSLLSPLLGNEQHELIAVVDDASSDRQLVETLGHAGLTELTEHQNRKFKELEQTITQLRGEIRHMAHSGGGGGELMSAGASDTMADWDPRFIKALRAKDSGVFNEPTGVRLTQTVESLLRVEPEFNVTGGRKPHVIVFVGPTGSGKTTTLAKLAARWCLTGKLSIGVVTLDTFRVAAVDQIREYSTLLGLELAVAFSAAEAGNAIKRFADKDLILVDTPGRNHFDQMGLAGIRGSIQAMGPVTVLLHLPAALDRRHVTDVVSNFEGLNPNYLVLTKTDETRHFGMLTAVVSETDCPIAFVTDGQRVPQDLHVANLKELAGLLAPGASAAAANGRMATAAN